MITRSYELSKAFGLFLAMLFFLAATSVDDEEIINNLEFFSIMDVLEMPKIDADLFLSNKTNLYCAEALGRFVDSPASPAQERSDHD